MATPCDNCLDFTKLGCDPISTDNVIYSGVNLACSGIKTNDDLTLAFQKMEALICQSAGSQNLQSVLENGNISTDIPILMQTASDPLLFTTVAFDRVRVENGVNAMTLTPDSLVFGLASTTLKAVPSVNSITYLLADRPAGTYTLASIDQVPVDADLLHKTGNEVKTGTLTVNAIIKAFGLPTQYLMADGSTSDISGIVSGIVAPTIVDGDTTHAPSGDAVYDALNLSLLHDVDVTGAVINQYLYKAADGFWKNKTIPVTDVINAESIVFKGVPNGYAPLNSLGIVPNVHIDPNLIGNVSLHGNWDQATNTPNLDVVKPKGWYYVCVSPTPTVRYGFTFRLNDWIISDGSTWSKVNNQEALVTSVFGRIGVVTAQNGDYTTALVPDTTNKRYQTDNQQLFNDATSSIQTQLNSKAPLASPAFTGTPTAPTAAPGTNTTQLATTAFVTGAFTTFDGNVVHKTGNINESINGTKTFNGNTIFNGNVTFSNSGNIINFVGPATFSDPGIVSNAGAPVLFGSNGHIGVSSTNGGVARLDTTLIGQSSGQQKTFTFPNVSGTFALTSQLAGFELLANKQNTLNYDGTGIKYSTVDAVNNLFRSVTEVATKTGLISKLDTFDLIAFTNTTARIAAVTSVVFWNELFVPSTAPGAAIRSFAQKDYPLAQLETATGGNVNINPITTNGKHVRYLGYDKNGNVYSSQTSFATNNDIFQFGIVTVVRTAGVISFLDGTVGPRNVLAIPNLASNTDFDKVTGVVVSVTAAPNAGASLNTSNGTLTGISINWKSPANPSNSGPIDVWNYVGQNPVPFRSINPLFLNGTAALSTHTLWTELEDAIQINEKFFNTTTQLPGTMAAGTASVKRILVGIRGNIYIQDGEHPNVNCYPDLVTAKNNIYAHKFSDAILPLGITFEIARVAYTKSATAFQNDAQFYLVNTAGSSSSSSSVIPAVPDATPATKGILQLSGDFDPTSTAALPIIKDATASVRGLVNTGVQTFAGNKTFNGSITATSHIKSGATTTNLLLAGGGDIPQSTFLSGAGVTGQVTFWGGTNNVTSDTNLFWDNTNKRLGIGNSSPSQKLEVTGNILATSFIKSGGLPSQFLMADGSVTTGVPGGITGSGTVNTLPKFGTSSSLVDSSLSDNGSLVTSTNDISFANGKGIILNTSGVNRNVLINAASTTDNFASASFYPSTGTNVATQFQVIPKGTGYDSNNKSQIIVFNTDYIQDAVNYEFLTIKAAGNSFVIGSGKTGTGVVRPLLLSAGAATGLPNPNQLWLYPSGRVGINTTSDGTDQLQVNGTTRIGSTLTLGTTPTTSAGAYDILTRNTSTGVVEKVASTTFASPITLIGTDTLASTAIGAGGSLSNPTTSIFLGLNAGNSPGAIPDHTNIIAIGTEAARNTIEPSNFIAIGRRAGYSFGTGNDNIFIGSETGYTSENTHYNVSIGYQTAYGATVADNSVFLGEQAGYGTSNAFTSVFIGSKSGKSTTNASYCILLGYQAGYNPSGNNIGSNNIIIGTNISLPNGQSNSINIGGVIFGTGTYSTAGGNPSTVPNASGRIGIGVNNPSEKLHVNGYVLATGYKIPGGTSSQFLMADGSTITGAGVTGTGSANYIAKWSSTSGLTTSSIYDNGNVGIGTTNPNFSSTGRVVLDINGSSSSLIAQSVGGVAKGYLYTNGTDYSINNEGTGILALANGGLQRLVITNNGNVGIGTINPTYKLHVSGNIGVSSGTDTLFISKITSYTGNITYDAGGSGNNHIFTGGNVGIGTNNPLQKFVVSNNGALGFEVALDPSNNYLTLLSIDRIAAAYRRIEYTASLHEFRTGIASIGTTNNFIEIITPSDGGKGLYHGMDITNRLFYWRKNDSDDYGFDFQKNNGTSFFRISSNGNVLIGTTSDTGAKLQVAGGAYLTGGLQIETTSGLFNFRSTSAAQNYGTFRQNDGSPLAYLGDANGSAIGGGAVSDFAVIAPNGKLFLNGNSGGVVIPYLSGSTTRMVIVQPNGDLGSAPLPGGFKEAQFTVSLNSSTVGALPIPTMFYNSIGGTFVFNRNSAGAFEVVNTGLLTAGKTTVTITMGSYQGGTSYTYAIPQGGDGNKVGTIYQVDTASKSVVDSAMTPMVTVRVYQ